LAYHEFVGNLLSCFLQLFFSSNRSLLSLLFQNYKTFHVEQPRRTQHSPRRGETCIQRNASGEVATICNILRSPSGATFVVFSPFEKMEPFSICPFSLCHLNLFTVSFLSTDITLQQLDNTCCKYVLLPQRPHHFWPCLFST